MPIPTPARGRPTAALLAASLALAATLGACRTPTPYQRAEGPLDEGYREQEITDNRYRVTFAGNAATSREAVETFLLYRAAELTLAEGYESFLVTERSTEEETGYAAATPPVYGHYRYGHHHHHGFAHHRFPYYTAGYPWSADRYFDVDREYEATAHIVMRPGGVGEDEEFAYDASEVVETLRPEVRRLSGEASDLGPTYGGSAASGGSS